MNIKIRNNENLFLTIAYIKDQDNNYIYRSIQKIKYLKINFTKEVQDFHTEQGKMSWSIF